MTEVPAFSKLLHTVLVPKPQNTQEPDRSAPPSIFPSASLLKLKENRFQILQTHWLPYLVAGPLRNTILATRVMLRTTPGNWLIQSSEKLGAPSARASLSLPGCCSLPGQLFLPAKSQMGSQEKSEPAEAAWDSSVDPRLGQAHWGFNNAIKPSFQGTQRLLESKR